MAERHHHSQARERLDRGQPGLVELPDPDAFGRVGCPVPGDDVPGGDVAGPVNRGMAFRPPDRLGWVVVVAGLMSPEPRGPLTAGSFRSSRTRAPVPASSGSMYGTEGTPGTAAGRVCRAVRRAR
ncbi:MAG: hypothetical protein OXG37_00985 [Actinomycetia bacterium]|nr:hypothetical protein [Actinomycetes bacterium]